VGVHTGECELVGEKPAGIAVHTGARIAAVANCGEILVSSTSRILSLALGSLSTIVVCSLAAASQLS
jgi:class 3 adenylate cyclase